MDGIEHIDTKLYRLPLSEPLTDALHGDHTHFELITTTVRLSSGLEGLGYTYTGGYGGQSIRAMIVHDLVPFLVGKDATEVEVLNKEMDLHVHYVGRGGIASFAVSALDIALWDCRCKRQNKPLWQVVGGVSGCCAAYRGGIDLNFSLSKLLNSVSSYLDEGYNGVKIKVGQEFLSDDIARIEAIRRLIGTDVYLMADANCSMRRDHAVQAAKAFMDYDILWFEEPVMPEDLQGYAKIAGDTKCPLAAGENLRTLYEFEMALENAALRYIQPDVSNCGGITVWLQIAEMARVKGITVCSHGMQELHVSLVSAQPNSGWLEVHSFPIGHYIEKPLQFEEHLAMVPSSKSGNGIEFDRERLEFANVA